MKDYLEKYSFSPELIQDRPEEGLEIVVVIPSYREKHLEAALFSLQSCTRPDCAVEVIVIVNQSEKADRETRELNRRSYEQAKGWEKRTAGFRDPGFSVYGVFMQDLPAKKAGVGLARKIGMDEAVRRFRRAGTEKKGIVACFDADCTCRVDYLTAIHHHFAAHPKSPGCSIRFEHPTFGSEFESKTYLGIIYYELHLRYYVQAIRATGAPYGFHTVGSSMAVRSTAYQKQGGMNKRQAGEDFYFLHKIIELGEFTELNDTVVYPSPRPSERVPFGTGKAINGYLKNPDKGFYTYNLTAFKYLARFFQCLPEFYITTPELVTLGGTIPYVLIDFLSGYFFDERIVEIKKNSRNLASFEKRFFRWFNAFMVLKFVHFVRDNAHKNVRVELAALELLRELGYAETENINSVGELLETYRKLDRGELELSSTVFKLKSPE